MPRRTPDGPQELTEHSADPEATPALPKAEKPREPRAEVLESLQERVSTYKDGAVVERLGGSGGTEKWTVNSVDARGTVFLTNENGKRAMMHETEVALEERAATFAPQLDAAWEKTVGTVADMTDDDDLQETAAFLKSHRGDILFLAAERMAANPDADPARELLGAVHGTQLRIDAEAKTSEVNRSKREEIAEAKRYIGITPDDAVRIADADNMLGTLRFGPSDPSVVDRGAPYVEHTRTISSVQLENIAAARATVAELAVLEPDLRNEILGDIPDIIGNERPLADIDAELKQVDDDLSFVEQQWRAHGKGDKNSAEADVYLKRTRSLREREKQLMAERRIVLTQANEVTAPLQESSDEEEVTEQHIPTIKRLSPPRTISKDDGRGLGSDAQLGALKIPPLKDFARDSERNKAHVAASRRTGEGRTRLEKRLADLNSDTYIAPAEPEPFRTSDRPTTPTRKNREIAEEEWMKEGESNKDLRTTYEETPKINPKWYLNFTKDFGGPEEFVSLFNEARARTNIIDFNFENLKRASTIQRWWYHRKMGKAVREMARQDAVKSKKKRGSLQA